MQKIKGITITTLYINKASGIILIINSEEINNTSKKTIGLYTKILTMLTSCRYYNQWSVFMICKAIDFPNFSWIFYIMRIPI